MTSQNPAARFQAAVEANAADLLRYLVRRVPDREDAADTLSEVFATAWRRRAHLPEEPQACRMWLFTIAKNTDLNHRRGRRRRDALVEKLRTLLAEPAEADHHRDDAVRAAMDSLPPEQAEIVRLLHWDGFKLVDAAELQGVSASTARSRYAAARHALRELLATSEANR